MRGMEEWKISVEATLAGILWVLGACLVMVDLWGDTDLGELGLWASGVGGVLTLRRSHLGILDIQRRAFDLGRDYERGRVSSGVRSLR